MEFVMTELEIELAEAINKIVSISERVKENPELGANLTYLFLAIKPGEEDGMVATVGASPKEVVSMFTSLMEEDQTFKECVRIANALNRMKSAISGEGGATVSAIGIGGIGSLLNPVELLKAIGEEKEEGEAKEGSGNTEETVSNG